MTNCPSIAVFVSVWLSLGCVAETQATERPDIVIADFDGDDYGQWKVSGDAFGTGPARGTLPNQMPVSGFLGTGLVNSYYGGDKSTGTLTSPPFKIARKYINVDQHTGGWGHINIDQIVESDRKREAQVARRELVVGNRYLNLPVKNGAAMRRVRLMSEGKTLREFEVELADDVPDFWVFYDLSVFKGRSLTIETKLPDGSKALDLITPSDEIAGAAELYREPHRPQYHFTSRRGWLNDPNGLVYAAGEYHLFYQHNPFGWNWGNMHWGHAVSGDLVHWQELPIALYPQQFGDWCFSGSAVLDQHNTSGFQRGDEPPLVVAYTSTGRGECIAYSNDRGRTWTEYEGNPVVKHAGRDPRLVWHEPTKHRLPSSSRAVPRT